jgi:cytochrome c
MRNAWVSVAVIATVVVVISKVEASPPATQRYGLGRIATPEEVRARDLSIAPDGRGLPAGKGTARQGQAVYVARCASCHGARGEGAGPYPAIAGGRGTLASSDPVVTVTSYWPFATSAWDYIRRAMPYDRPGSLAADEVYAVTAYVLHLDSIVDLDTVLDATTLPAITMPNRDGFVPDPRPDVAPPAR